jgi:hypothetical protein
MIATVVVVAPGVTTNAMVEKTLCDVAHWVGVFFPRSFFSGHDQRTSQRTCRFLADVHLCTMCTDHLFRRNFHSAPREISYDVAGILTILTFILTAIS